jgi:HPr kinase/phosphorylase
VADDLVELRRDGLGIVVGTSPELIRNHMEVRGLGIINIWELFGVEAVARECAVELVVELVEWEYFRDMDRTGLLQRTFTLLEKDIPLLRIPASLNRNLAIILEVAVRNHLLKQRGIRPLERLARRIESQLRTKASS